MQYLLTGGAGFIGTHLARHLQTDGHQVVSVDIQAPERPVPGVEYVQSDIRDHRVLGPLMARVDGIFHLAAVVGFANVMKKMRETITTNTAGTELVLHYAQMRGTPVLIASTSACYGRATNQKVVCETDDAIFGPTITTSWAYAYAKAADEALAFAYHQEYELPVIVVRIFNTVGPGQSAEAGFVLPRFVMAALEGRPIPVHAPGTQSRTFAHVRDVVGALNLLMQTPRAHGELVNVGGTERCTMLELAHRVVAYTQSSSDISLVPHGYGDGYDNVTDRVPCLDKLRALTGHVPNATLDEMIQDVMSDYVPAGESTHNLDFYTKWSGQA